MNIIEVVYPFTIENRRALDGNTIYYDSIQAAQRDALALYRIACEDETHTNLPDRETNECAKIFECEIVQLTRKSFAEILNSRGGRWKTSAWIVGRFRYNRRRNSIAYEKRHDH
jgi:hypothetical protein